MAHHFVSVSTLPEGGEKLAPQNVAGLRGGAFLVGAVGLIFSAIVFSPLNPFGLREAYSYSWLFALAFYITIVSGGLFWTLLHHAANASWGVVVRRLWEKIADMFPYLLLLSLPLLIPDVREKLYEWMAEHHAAVTAHPEQTTAEALHHSANPHHHLLYEKYSYMNLPFWLGRFIGCLAILIISARLMLRFSLRQEKDGAVSHTFGARGWARVLLLPFAISLTFIAIDWFKGLDYTWYSTMFGVYIFAGSALNAMALSFLLVTFLRSRGYLQQVITTEHYHLMGKLMLAFTIFWAYVSYSQFFLIWYANITEETRFFLMRNTEGWNYLSIFIVLFHFFVPFVAQLPVWMKKNPRYICGVALWMLFMHALDMYWLIIPERAPSMGYTSGPTLPGAWMLDVVAFVTMGAFLIWAFLGKLLKHSLYPWRDPRLQESINVTN